MTHSNAHVQRRRRTATVALLAMIGALLALAVPGAPSAAEPVPASGTATWGIRQTYRNYINGPVANGFTTVSDGATWLDGPGVAKGPFTFPVADATFDEATTTGEVRLSGTVSTGGHDYGAGHILEGEWSNLRLQIDGDEGVLVADLRFRPFVGANPSVPRPDEQIVADVPFATVDLSGVNWTAGPDGVRTITNAPAVGITEAMELIGWDDFYYSEMPNPPLDAFSLSFVEARDDSTTTTTGSTTSTTTSTTTTTTAPPTTTTAPLPPAESIISGGELSWGVYKNFINYVNGPVANGTTTATGGASGNPRGPFLFPAVTGDAVDITAANLTLAFTGTFTARGHIYDDHPPALEMTFSNFRVVKTGTTGRLLADVVSRPFLDATQVAAPETTPGAHLADLDFSQAKVGRIGNGVGWLDIPAKVAANGAALWGGFYEGGQKLDPLTIVLNLTNPPTLPPAVRPPAEAGPSVTLGATTVAAGSALPVNGTGFTPNEQVEVWIHSTPTFLQTVRADGNGNVSAAIVIPASTPSGTHRLELRGISSGTSVFSPEFQVTGGGRTGSNIQRPSSARRGPLAKTGADTSSVPLGVGLVGSGLLVVLAASWLRRRGEQVDPLA